jgi:hypothetical protein
MYYAIMFLVFYSSIIRRKKEKKSMSVLYVVDVDGMHGKRKMMELEED